jgi:hypothetical protein
MMLAGVPVPDRLVLILAGKLRDAGLDLTAQRLETAGERETDELTLDVSERDDILKVLAACPPGLGELRAVLLEQQAGRANEGIS